MKQSKAAAHDVIERMSLGEIAREFLLLSMRNSDGNLSAEGRRRLKELSRQLRPSKSYDDIWLLAIIRELDDMVFYWELESRARQAFCETLRGSEQDQEGI